MRYYSYISDAKLDMLLPQVPGAQQRKVAAQYGFDLEAISASYKSEKTTLDSQFARLNVVEDYIRKNQPVGEHDEMTSWIADEADATLVDLGGNAVLFSISGKNYSLGLGGSAKHLIGSPLAEASSGLSFSFLPRMTERLVRLSEQSPETLLFMSGLHMTRHVSPTAQEFGAWISVMRWIEEFGHGTPQRVTFLSKRLVSEEDHRGRVYTLASPLFVALAD